ncbi:hypothetical protein [Pseudomonas sp. RIT-To-2]|uniref:hypothetical protein n=1 Tax=Pseudomonas sp. RIT-To-2 TaxID=3462541 RepID=UPI002412F7E9
MNEKALIIQGFFVFAFLKKITALTLAHTLDATGFTTKGRVEIAELRPRVVDSQRYAEELRGWKNGGREQDQVERKFAGVS